MKSEKDLRLLAARRLKRARALQLETARAAQAAGRARYLVSRGLLQYGSILLALIVGFSFEFSPDWSPLGASGWLANAVARSILLCPLAALLGVAIALTIWHRLERVWFPKLKAERGPNGGI
ncbi:MAG: hypothetical protein KJZ74_14195 [Gemmatimonadales bacterium]|nr:hypothetical protein [Gemmatimonadales bacterium]